MVYCCQFWPQSTPSIFVTFTIFCLVYIFFQFEIASSTIGNAYLILKMVKTTSA